MEKSNCDIDLSTLEPFDQELIIKYFELDNQPHPITELETEFGFTGDVDGLVDYVNQVVNTLPTDVRNKLHSL